MRLSCLVLAAVPALWLSEGVAQEPTDEDRLDQICEQCPFDAPVRIPRDDFAPSRPDKTIVTAEDMRALGVVSVADMIKQLPQRISEDSESSAGDADDQDAEPDETEADSSEE